LAGLSDAPASDEMTSSSRQESVCVKNNNWWTTWYLPTRPA
jgi:hypothetical protein